MSHNLEQLEGITSLRSKTMGTSLVTIYVPGSSNTSFINGMITKELSTASNIKDKSVRKGVISALKSCASFLKTIPYAAPENGLVLLAGETEYCV